MLKMEGSSSLALMILLVLLTLMMMVCEVKMVHGDELSPSQCKEERRLGINACKPVVFGRPASPACCKRVRVSHFECVCPVITPKLASLIGVNRAIKVLKGCGRRVPRHFECGSLYFP